MTNVERDLRELLVKVDALLTRVDGIDRLLRHERDWIMSALEDLAKQVQANTDVEQSALTLIGGLAEQLKAAGTDGAKLAALQAQLETSRASLAAAIVANTPAAPSPAPAPTVPPVA